jgi:hypothetical protein
MSGWGGLFSPGSGSDDDLVSDMRKHLKNIAEEKAELNEKSKAAYRNAKNELGIGRRLTRQEKPKNEWKVPDVCFEFADRIEQHFHIAPWKVTQSKFSGALASARKRLGTDGEVEVAAMDLFFKQISISEYKDAEVLWRLFVSRLPGLIKGAVLSVKTDEDVLMAEEAWDKAQRILRGEDV